MHFSHFNFRKLRLPLRISFRLVVLRHIRANRSNVRHEATVLPSGMLLAVCINHVEQTAVARKQYFIITRRLSNKVHDLLGTLQKSSVAETFFARQRCYRDFISRIIRSVRRKIYYIFRQTLF